LPRGTCVDDNNPDLLELILVIDNAIEETIAKEQERGEGAGVPRARILGRRPT